MEQRSGHLPRLSFFRIGAWSGFDGRLTEAGGESDGGKSMLSRKVGKSMLSRSSSRERFAFTLVEIMIVVAIIGILVAIAVPGFINARAQSRAKACQEGQEKLDGATQQWALENNQTATATPTWAQLVGPSLYLSRTPRCPEAGSVIALHSVGTVAVCPSTVASHLRQ